MRRRHERPALASRLRLKGRIERFAGAALQLLGSDQQHLIILVVDDVAMPNIAGSAATTGRAALYNATDRLKLRSLAPARAPLCLPAGQRRLRALASYIGVRYIASANSTGLLVSFLVFLRCGLRHAHRGRAAA